MWLYTWPSQHDSKTNFIYHNRISIAIHISTHYVKKQQKWNFFLHPVFSLLLHIVWIENVEIEFCISDFLFQPHSLIPVVNTGLRRCLCKDCWVEDSLLWCRMSSVSVCLSLIVWQVVCIIVFITLWYTKNVT